ncbi:MAG TPA: hypothetical protein VMZ92_03495 [Planctomycetota bacterium]|nr:hypothetical protein [Planctomycetota bacterium]
MKTASVPILVLCVALGCATPPAPPKELPAAASRDYDLVWDATVTVLEKHFELWVQDKEKGYIVSTYKRAEPLPDEYARDAQTGYDALEEFLHIVRRRATARVLEDHPGVYGVHLEIIRERQGYVPPKRDYSSSYSLYDRRKTALDDSADQKPTVTWYRLGRDLHLEKKLLERIQVYLNRHARR